MTKTLLLQVIQKGSRCSLVNEGFFPLSTCPWLLQPLSVFRFIICSYRFPVLIPPSYPIHLCQLRHHQIARRFACMDERRPQRPWASLDAYLSVCFWATCHWQLCAGLHCLHVSPSVHPWWPSWDYLVASYGGSMVCATSCGRSYIALRNWWQQRNLRSQLMDQKSACACPSGERRFEMRGGLEKEVSRRLLP